MKYVSDIGNSENFRELLTTDLKELGIKLPKVKKNKNKLDKSSANNPANVFGEELSHLPLTQLQQYGSVPKFLVEAIQVLDDHLAVEGIFRKAGSVARQKELKTHIESGGGLENVNPLDLACVVKQFFRQLPEPLLTCRLHDAFLHCNSLGEDTCISVQGGQDVRSAAVLHLCLLLPHIHVSTLRYITTFLHRVAQHASVNKMHTENLAMCLAPNFLHSSMSDKQQVSPGVLQAQAEVVSILIIHAEEIGMVPEPLWERAALLAACCPLEDEQDGGSGAHNDSKSKKKKRRSGSLQGMISNLSSSFTKWRSKDGKSHNSSSLSDRSTFSTMSYVSFTSQDDGAMDDSNSVDLEHQPEMALPSYTWDPENEATPKVIRKRKAEEEAVPFSASKRKAILQGMPQMSALGGTPYTPQSRKPPVRGQTDFQNTPSIKFSNNSGVVFSATPRVRKPRRPDASPTPNKRHTAIKSGCFSPKSSKNGVRKSVKGFIRRLSGNREPSQAESFEEGGQEGDADLDDLSRSSQTKKGLFRRLKKTPSSPARLVTSLTIEHPSLNATDTNSVTLQDEEMEMSYAGPNLSVQSEIVGGASRQRRHAVAADCSLNPASLRRGRPNTLTTGLPSPVKRRSIDTSSLKHGHSPFVSPEKSDNPSALDTSPILGVGALGTVGHVSDDEDDEEDMFERRSLERQSSKSSVTSEVGYHTSADSDHDKAFLHESLLAVDEPHTSNEDEEDVLKDDTGKGEEMPNTGEKTELKYQKSIGSLDSGIDGSSLSKTESLHSVLSADSGLGSRETSTCHLAQSSDLINLGSGHLKAKLTSQSQSEAVDNSRLQEDIQEVAARKASPLRFACSTSRRRPGASPVRIPSIFVKADAEIQKYRDRKASPHLLAMSTSKRTVHLPISTNLVRTVQLDSVRTKLALDENQDEHEVSQTPECPRKMTQETAGHTPQCTRLVSSLQAVEIPDDSPAEDNKNPLHQSNSINISHKPPPGSTASSATPIIKPMLGSSHLASRRPKSVKPGSRANFSPVKPVKRLQVSSPHSPLTISHSQGESASKISNFRRKHTVV